ncbi:MAG TPA: type II toxin-antitoxin system PemK/MazF family toxin [Anaerolineales bacterium]|nr:type II toxin-antitoxin system PemK/MazF family toxin [Anaerolineales bacterium]
MISMRKGEIWLINLNPTIGPEIRKMRPAVIVNDNAVGVLPLRVIVPLTDWKERYAIALWMVKIEPAEANGLTKTSAADSLQIRSISTERFVSQIGTIAPEKLESILSAIQAVIGK